jgi:hypothetical protein
VNSDDAFVLTMLADVPMAGPAPVPVGPAAADIAVLGADPLPTDLVISLSRITC